MFSLLFLCVVKDKEKVRFEANCAVNNQTSWAGNTLGWLNVCVDVWSPDSDSLLPVSHWPCRVVPRTCWFSVLSNSLIIYKEQATQSLPLWEYLKLCFSSLRKHYEFEKIAVLTIITSYKKKMFAEKSDHCFVRVQRWHGVEFISGVVVSCLCLTSLDQCQKKNTAHVQCCGVTSPFKLLHYTCKPCVLQ